MDSMRSSKFLGGGYKKKKSSNKKKGKKRTKRRTRRTRRKRRTRSKRRTTPRRVDRPSSRPPARRPPYGRVDGARNCTRSRAPPGPTGALHGRETPFGLRGKGGQSLIRWQPQSSGVVCAKLPSYCWRCSGICTSPKNDSARGAERLSACEKKERKLRS